MVSPTRQDGPLHGIRVVDFTEGLAGHFCTMLLGDQGAEVIKIETLPDGDPARSGAGPRFQDEGIGFLAANRNKLSVAIDVQRSDGLAALHRLVATADVYVGAHSSQVAESLGVDWSRLSQSNPRLVYCSITGRGESGPGAELPSNSTTAEAQAGLMSVTGEADGPPVTIGVPLIENVTAIFAKDAITAALLARAQSGRGQKVETSLLESAVAVLGMPASAYLMTGLVAGRWGTEHEWHVPWKTFETSDGHVVIACSSEEQWRKICDALGRAELAKDQRFATMQLRALNRRELYRILDGIIAGRPTDYWLVELARAGGAAAPVNTIDRVFADPQVLVRHMVQSVEHGTIGALPQVGHPQKFSGTPAAIRLPPPVLGEHTAVILEELADVEDV